MPYCKGILLKEIMPLRNNSEILNLFIKAHGMTLKKLELDDLMLFLDFLYQYKFPALESYFFFDTIAQPPINDEFDMLHTDENYLLNIDFKDNRNLTKKRSVDLDTLYSKIIKKFARQFRLLKTISNNRSIINITLIFNDQSIEIYKYDPDNTNLVKINVKELFSVLSSIRTGNPNNEILKLDANDFVISPIKDTQKFINNNYWLTQIQNDIVEEITKNLGNPLAYGIQGTAGAGKTMIAFDIAKNLCRNNKVLYVFTGSKRDGHRSLEQYFTNLTIMDAKNFANCNLTDYDVIIVDEAQRSFRNVRVQIDNGLQLIKHRLLKRLIILFGTRQTISKYDMGQAIANLLTGRAIQKKLPETVRINEYIFEFIQQLFDKSYNTKKEINGNTISPFIDFSYFTSENSAIDWIESKKEEGYIFIQSVPELNHSRMTPDTSITTEVIGEDIDKVVVLIDENYFYKYNSESKKNELKNKLEGTNHYNPVSNLYIAATRAKNKLAIAILNNKEVLEALANKIFN